MSMFKGPGAMYYNVAPKKKTTPKTWSFSWDGNTEGLESVSLSQGLTHSRVSDKCDESVFYAMTTALENGAKVTIIERTYDVSDYEYKDVISEKYITVEGYINGTGVCVPGVALSDGSVYDWAGNAKVPAVMWIPVDAEGSPFRKGIWVRTSLYPSGTNSSLLVSSVVPLTKADGKSIFIWDGNTEGKKVGLFDYLYKVSDYTPEFTRFANGATVDERTGENSALDHSSIPVVEIADTNGIYGMFEQGITDGTTPCYFMCVPQDAIIPNGASVEPGFYMAFDPNKKGDGRYVNFVSPTYTNL